MKWSWERLQNIKGSAVLHDGRRRSASRRRTRRRSSSRMEAPNSEFLGILTAPYTGVINSDVAIANGANADADADHDRHGRGLVPRQFRRQRPVRARHLQAGRRAALQGATTNYWREQRRRSPRSSSSETKDAVAQAQMLESGAADIAMQIDPDTAKTISSDERARSRSVPSYNFVYVAFSPGAKGNPVPLTQEVREAIALRARLRRHRSSSRSAARASCRPRRSPTASRHRRPADADAGSRQGQGAAGQGRARRTASSSTSIVSEHERLRRRPLAADAEGPAGSGQGQHQGRPAAASTFSVWREQSVATASR